MAKTMSELIAEFLAGPPHAEAVRTLGRALHETGPVLFRGQVWRSEPYGEGHWRVTRDDPDPRSLIDSEPARRYVLPKKFRAKRRAGHPPAEKVNVPAPPSSQAEKMGRTRNALDEFYRKHEP
jgi:hypothetical protein